MCGLAENDIDKILECLDSDEQPYSDSGSEFQPTNSVASSEDEIDQMLCAERHSDSENEQTCGKTASIDIDSDIDSNYNPSCSNTESSVPPEPPTILDQYGRLLNGTVGPHDEGDDITMKCRTVGGHPQPIVRWLVNGLIVDDHYEHNAGDVIENVLVWPSISRRDLDALFTCQAVNTKLTEPKEAFVVLDLRLPPLTATILKTESPLVADKRYEVTCESAGSRPPAIITWYKGKRQLKRTKQS
ncbi:unnamed protein product [Diabrotica balteata]|uniref:Ig-like domain-containing protein n=1 Tax=Diabrotica balteata TaxID=107213 RepID=A0A9N9XGK6_DIABA|nr:unnamed protein product [Diabrotica balteata]